MRKLEEIQIQLMHIYVLDAGKGPSRRIQQRLFSRKFTRLSRLRRTRSCLEIKIPFNLQFQLKEDKIIYRRSRTTMEISPRTKICRLSLLNFPGDSKRMLKYQCTQQFLFLRISLMMITYDLFKRLQVNRSLKLKIRSDL